MEWHLPLHLNENLAVKTDKKNSVCCPMKIERRSDVCHPKRYTITGNWRNSVEFTTSSPNITELIKSRSKNRRSKKPA
jgi:hypothetical protein